MGYQHRVHGECAIGHCILLSKSTPFDLRSSKMKYFALLMVVGLAAASSTGLGRELKFDAGKEYLFQYSGRLMSGIPELANQYSGLAINATVGSGSGGSGSGSGDEGSGGSGSGSSGSGSGSGGSGSGSGDDSGSGGSGSGSGEESGVANYAKRELLNKLSEIEDELNIVMDKVVKAQPKKDSHGGEEVL